MQKLGEYKLNRASGGLSHYARVWVRIEEADTGSVTLDASDFAWLKEEYGPDAWQWAVCDDYRDEALDGCRYALDHLAAPPTMPLHVHVIGIHAHPAHTTKGSVKMAACLAVWRALEDEGRDRPELLDGSFHFGDQGSHRGGRPVGDA